MPVPGSTNHSKPPVAADRQPSGLDPDEGELRHFAGLLDDIDAGVIATDPDFIVTSWTPAAERLYGQSAGDVLGHPAREVAALAANGALAQLEQELSECGRSRIGLVTRRPDGSRLDVEIVAVAVRARPHGELVGYLALHQDVTERRRLERERRRLLTVRTEVVVEGVTDAFCVFDQHWRCAHVNTRALLLATDLARRPFGREDLVGRAVADVFPGFAAPTSRLTC